MLEKMLFRNAWMQKHNVLCFRTVDKFCLTPVMLFIIHRSNDILYLKLQQDGLTSS